jgi:hypothetical protein
VLFEFVIVVVVAVVSVVVAVVEVVVAVPEEPPVFSEIATVAFVVPAVGNAGINPDVVFCRELPVPAAPRDDVYET